MTELFNKQATEVLLRRSALISLFQSGSKVGRERRAEFVPHEKKHMNIITLSHLSLETECVLGKFGKSGWIGGVLVINEQL